MQQITLGETSLKSSRLAYGCWRIAASDDEAANLKTSADAITAALDAGYSLFDLADIYCQGRSEAVFGAFLRRSPNVREQIVIATKCGIRLPDDPAQGSPYRYDLSAAHIVASCEESLRRLGVETIDLYQLHRPDFLLEPDEVAEAFSRLRSQGKVREFGVSNFNPFQVTLLQQACARPLAVNQIEASLLRLSPFSDGTLAQCMAQKMTPLAWSPLGAGLLGEGASSLLPSQREYRAGGAIEELDRLALAHSSTRTAIALAWLLRHPAGIVPIVGSTRQGRIRDAARAVEVPLSREEWYGLLQAASPRPLP